MDCKLMLQSTFDWAKKGQVSGGEFPTYATVFATVTIHQSYDRNDKKSDIVWYGNGPLSLQSLAGGEEVLTGNIQAWVNKTELIFIPPKPTDDIGSYTTDLFPNTPDLGLLVTVTKTGLVTVGKLIKGHLIGGLPATTFQASCDKELLTGIVNIAGDAVCTVSFSLGSK